MLLRHNHFTQVIYIKKLIFLWSRHDLLQAFVLVIIAPKSKDGVGFDHLVARARKDAKAVIVFGPMPESSVSEIINQRQHPLVERNSIILAYYHPKFKKFTKHLFTYRASFIPIRYISHV